MKRPKYLHPGVIEPDRAPARCGIEAGAHDFRTCSLLLAQHLREQGVDPERVAYAAQRPNGKPRHERSGASGAWAGF